MSHIFPKWSFRWHKAEGSVEHHPAGSAMSVSMQDGYKHYMLCGDCEQFLGEGERALEMLSSRQPTALEGTGVEVERIDNGRFVVVGARRTLLLRALLGIVLKSHYAPSTIQKLRSDQLVAKVRHALQNDDYSDFVGPFAAKWYGGSPHGINPRSYTGIGFSRILDATVVQVGLAGVDWFMTLDGEHGATVSTEWGVEVSSLRFRAAWFDDWEDQEAGIPDSIWMLGDADWCPCGLGTAFGECCRTGWLA
ncbi:hypothetical protein [Cellulosimicrobium cellulans]|uniref:hypothetical protein n=1 Tax=Cellulosimicrobium cellulans TaxID=1710 RepID=UPI001112D03F|nr:hypothetical protein [Cellulosimicrobium cellulans]